ALSRRFIMKTQLQIIRRKDKELKEFAKRINQLIDDRLKKIEGSSDESSSEEVIKTIVVEVTRNLLKVSIYPSQNKFREETEKVLRSLFPELHKKFRQSPIFYEKNIY